MYKEFHDILHQSKTDVNINLDKREFWKMEIALFTKDIKKTIDFIDSECNDEEFYYLSEIFDEISTISQSKEFIKTIENRLKPITDKEYIRSISYEIDSAKANINKA